MPSKQSPSAKATQKIRVKASRPLLQRTWFQACVVLAMGAALSAVIVFQPASRSPIPRLEPGEVAPREINVTASFTIVREDTTGLEERRTTAANQVLPVWDFDTAVSTAVVDRVKQGFALMRGYLQQAAAEELALAGTEERDESEDAAGEGSGTGSAAAATPEPEEPEEPQAAPDPMVILTPAQRERVALSHRTDLIRAIQAGLDPSTVTVLGREGFTSRAEDIVGEVLSRLLAYPVVHSRDVLLAEQAGGIALRQIHRDQVEREEARAQFDDFLDPQSALESIRTRLDPRLPPDTSDEVAAGLAQLMHELVRANVNTRFNATETDRRRRDARAAIEPVTSVHTYREGDTLIHAGQTISPADAELLALAAVHGERQPTNESRPNEVVFGGVIYVLLVLIGIFTYGVRFLRKFEPNFKDLACMTAILFVSVTLAKLVMMLATLIAEKSHNFPIEAIYAAIPFAAGGMLVRLVLRAEHALLYTIVFSLLVAVLLPEHPIFAAYALVGGLTGIGAVDVASTRMSIFRAGLLVGLVNAAFAAAMAMMSSSLFELSSLALIGLALLGGLLSATLTTALAPLVETVFHYITDIKLLELANPNHPAIRELLLHAPGSYQHSMMVGSLVEAGCKSVGAHALLGRVGSYYHDIGKAKNPRFFAENQSGKNPHDKLKPHMSALIIKSHVKDGIEMASNHGLPEEIIRFIREHHGTSLISYFYHKAKEMEDPDIQEVDEDDFRYPGPRPQTPETAICLLADGIEAASRAMTEPTPARLQGLVQRLINSAFTDGQLDECDLTLRDLDAIAREFIRILVSIYHHRPEYPDRKSPVDARRPTASGPQTAVPAKEAAKEASNGSGDPSSVDGGQERSEPEPTSVDSSTTLRRLGIDQGRAVDSPNRRQRD